MARVFFPGIVAPGAPEFSIGPPMPPLPVPPPPVEGAGSAVRFEDLPLEIRLTMPAPYQRELVGRPENRRRPSATDARGQLCTRYFKQTNPTTGRTIWKTLTGQPCGTVASPRPPPQPRPRPTPVPARRACYDGSAIIAHIEGLLQNGADVYGGLGAWKEQGTRIIATNLPVCKDSADELTARQLELRNRIPPPGAGMPATVPASIQMYSLQLRKVSPKLWRDEWMKPE